MKYTRKKTVILSAIVLLVSTTVLGIFLFTKSGSKNIKISLKEEIKKGPSMTIKGLKLEQTDGKKIEWVLNSKYADMYNSGAPNSEMVFKNVSTVVYGTTDQDQTYKINANSGTYWVKEDKIDLTGKVNVDTPNGYSFYTEDAFYDVANKKLSTKSSVTATGNSNKGDKLYVEGSGLKGDVNAGNFYLIGNVSAKMGNKLSIKSKKALFDTKKEDVSFINGVTAKKERMNINSQELTVAYSKQGEMSDINVKNKVLIKLDDKKAICDNALIKANSDEVVLTGKPEFHSGKDIIVGQKIVFFTNSDEVYVSKVKAAVSEQGVRKK